ncbi:2,3,4,5-tetrahydropyridine-2,6-dicarboxylate N-succinyltransferase [bacterium]|nr:MAG: 2,3,4,5-tetrahydropyridine-2,6-dicarboxylate N-succinyltransferase [bacterium]
MTSSDLKNYIEALALNPQPEKPTDFSLFFEAFLTALENGTIRSAEKVNGSWKANSWVKQGILFGFKYGKNVAQYETNGFQFFDKETYPIQKFDGVTNNIRIVPGGSTVRRGSFVGKNVTMMPPMYINAGAFVDDGSMIDSHALVGSCAQVGKRCHISAAAQLGGVLEPIGATPVIIEDDCMVGGNTGIYEGTQVGESAVIGAGVILTRATPVYDLVKQTVYKATAEEPLKIPAGAVVIPGTRPIQSNAFAKEHGLAISSPVIIKYRDDKTELSTTLEQLLR